MPILLSDKKKLFIHYNIHTNKPSEIKDVDDLIPYLSDIFELDGDVTFEKFLNLLLLNSEKYNYVFNSYLINTNMEIIKNEFNSEIQYLDDDEINELEKIEYLLFKWSDIYVSDDELKGSSQIDENNFIFLNTEITLIGIGKDGSEYNIDATHINKLKKYKIKIDNNFKIIVTDRDSSNNIITANKNITVFDILSGLFFTLTFFGTTKEEKNKKINDIKKIQTNMIESLNKIMYDVELKSMLSKFKIKFNSEN